MGRSLGAPGDPLLVSRALGREVLDARDDGDRPQRRPQRRVGAGPGAEQRQPRASRTTPTAGCSQMFGGTVLGIEGELFRDALDDLKKDRGTTADTDLDVEDLQELVDDLQGDHREARRPAVPAGPARAARPRRPRRLRLVEHRPRRALPPPGADPRGPRHRGQHPGDGVRQLRRRLRLRRLLHPRPAPAATRACTATTCRTRRARTSSPASATPCRWPTWPRSTRPRTTSCSRSWRRSSTTTGHVRHRVHRRARQALDAADPGRQAHAGGGVPDRGAHGRRGPDRHGRGAAPRHRRAAGAA